MYIINPTIKCYKCCLIHLTVCLLKKLRDKITQSILQSLLCSHTYLPFLVFFTSSGSELSSRTVSFQPEGFPLKLPIRQLC